MVSNLIKSTHNMEILLGDPRSEFYYYRCSLCGAIVPKGGLYSSEGSCVETLRANLHSLTRMFFLRVKIVEDKADKLIG